MFIVRKDHKVILADNNRKRLETTLKYKPELKGLEIEETSEDWQLINGEYRLGGLTLDELKEVKRSEINKARDEAEQGGFEYMGKTFDSDPISCQRISCAAQAMQTLSLSTEVPSITWTCKDNSTVDLSPSDLVGLVVALADHSNKCHQKATELKAKIDACETKEELDLIIWE